MVHIRNKYVDNGEPKTRCRIVECLYLFYIFGYILLDETKKTKKDIFNFRIFRISFKTTFGLATHYAPLH